MLHQGPSKVGFPEKAASFIHSSLFPRPLPPPLLHASIGCRRRRRAAEEGRLRRLGLDWSRKQTSHCLTRHRGERGGGGSSDATFLAAQFVSNGEGGDVSRDEEALVAKRAAR